MFGCTAGKDRTGLIALLVQKLLRIAEEDIIEEYLLTNLCNGVMAMAWCRAHSLTLQRLRATFGEDDQVKAALRPVFKRERPHVPEEKIDQQLNVWYAETLLCWADFDVA